MAVDERYQRARATREESSREVSYGGYVSKRNQKKIFNKVKKSALLIIIVITLTLGTIGGFFLTKYTSSFEMLAYKVNGVQSVEKDYVIVDVSQIREDLEKNQGIQNITMEDIYGAVNLEDQGIKCRFLGMDISKTITKTYYYREDISYPAVEVKSIDVSVPGVYYIQYSSSHFAYKKTTLIRTIVVTGVEVDG